MKFSYICLITTMLLTGCENEKSTPSSEIWNIGNFDGCNVKFVNRGKDMNSFYIARCDNTVTTTRNYEIRNQKFLEARRSTTINQEIEKLQQEKKEMELKEQALAKLSPEEKAVLGVK